MRNPFPGMNPFLEAHWGDVHATLIVLTREALQTQLPEDLRARIEERVYLESDSTPVRQIRPDVRISQAYPEPAAGGSFLKEGEAAVAEPILFEVHTLPATETFIEIRERGGGKVITVIEFLSPANKSGGAGEEKYLEKQSEVLRSETSLVEIDLVRTGWRVLALPSADIPLQNRNDYLACISPGWKREQRQLFAMPLRKRLPVLPIPLRAHEACVKLDLQPLIDQAFVAGRFDDLDYAVELDPPLPENDKAWVAELLKRTNSA